MRRVVALLTYLTKKDVEMTWGFSSVAGVLAVEGPLVQCTVASLPRSVVAIHRW